MDTDGIVSGNSLWICIMLFIYVIGMSFLEFSVVNQKNMIYTAQRQALAFSVAIISVLILG